MRLQHFLRSSCKNNLTTQASSFRTHINHIIGSHHHILIMLHNNDRVTDIPQLLQRMNKPLIIPLMQANTRLIKNIKYIYQLRTDLGSQTDTLALTAGKGYRTTVKSKVIQSHIQQKFQTGADFFQYFDSNLFLFIIQILIDIHQPVVKLIDIHTRQFIDILIMDTEMKGFFIQSCPFTFRAYSSFSKLFRPLLRSSGSILFL